MQHKYSIDEIDRLRKALHTYLVTGLFYYTNEMEQTVELQLRTHMLNGTTPEDMEEKAKEKHNAWLRTQGFKV